MHKLKKIRLWLSKTTNTASKIWHVWLAVIGAISSLAGVFLTLYVWQFPIQEIQTVQEEIRDAKYDFTKVFNDQTLKTENMSGGELIKEYYKFLNSAEYQKACSLRSTQKCTLYDEKKFTDWVEAKNRYYTIKLFDGERVEKVWFSGEKLETTNNEIWCAKIRYRINSEVVDIVQTNQYNIAKRPDKKKEIRRILCEGELKRGLPTANCQQESKICVNSEPK